MSTPSPVSSVGMDMDCLTSQGVIIEIPTVVTDWPNCRPDCIVDLLRGLKSEKFGANTKKSLSGASAVGWHGWWQGAGSLGVNESGS